MPQLISNAIYNTHTQTHISRFNGEYVWGWSSEKNRSGEIKVVTVCWRTNADERIMEEYFLFARSAIRFMWIVAIVASPAQIYSNTGAPSKEHIHISSEFDYIIKPFRNDTTTCKEWSILNYLARYCIYPQMWYLDNGVWFGVWVWYSETFSSYQMQFR